MAKMTVDEILGKIRDLIGDKLTTDEGIELVEAITDTVTAEDGEDWESKYRENDAAWRKRYSDRFYDVKTPDLDEDDAEHEEIEEKSYKIEDLFKEEERK